MSQPLINPEKREPKEKKSDTRPWFKKKRWAIPLGFLALMVVLSAFADDEESATQSSETQSGGQASETSDSEQGNESRDSGSDEGNSEELSVVTLTVPDLTGQNTSDALDELEELGFVEVNPQDATFEERLVLLYSNWYVCATRPAAGTSLDSDKTIVLLSVKNSETCPGDSSGSMASSEGETSDGASGEPALPTPTSAEISAGTYIVGTEITPGFYRVSRYFARLDANQDIIDNDLVWDEGWTIVNVESTDKYLEISGVAFPLEAMPVLDPMAEGFTDGTYLVGTDIQPGTYRVNASPGGMAYAARLSCDRDIIDNDLNSGSVILTVRESDCLFEIGGTLERIE